MSLTDDFQRDVSRKLSNYFERKITSLRSEDVESYNDLRREYEHQLSIIQQTQPDHNINLQATDFHHNWLTCMAEPITEYNLGDLTHRREDDNIAIYSPRIDIAITPAVIKNRSRKISMGVYRFAMDMQLFTLIHRLECIQEIESLLREISNRNLRDFNLRPPEEVTYTNSRPMHLFGIEIENQQNPKHLMGDFLNAISLSKIPIILVPEENFINCTKMLLFSTTIRDLKEVPIYDLLNTAILLRVDQFRNAMNQILESEDLETIQTLEYR